MALSHYQQAYDDGLERAALNLQRKADKMREGVDPGSESAIMAHIFEVQADEILALRHSAKLVPAGK